jgi:hypothetical protein
MCDFTPAPRQANPAPGIVAGSPGVPKMGLDSNCSAAPWPLQTELEALSMFAGLPGGSPGPDAQASWRTLIFFAIFALLFTGLMLWFMFYAMRAVNVPVGATVPGL